MDKAAKQFERMTKTPIPKLVISLGIPTIISMLVTNIYNMADTYFVGMLKSTPASGAVGVVFGYMAVVQAIGFMFGQGAGSVISRKLGARKDEEATTVASTSFFSALFVGLCITCISLLCVNPLLNFLGSTDTIYPYAKSYIKYIMFAAPITMTSFVLNNILRYEGKAALAMIGLCSGSLINIALDPLLMFGLDMGIAGAGFATAFSQCISFSILLFMFLQGKTQSKLSFKEACFTFTVVSEIVATGFPSFIRQGLTSISTMVLNRTAGHYGDPAIAAMSIVNRLAFFMFAVGLGLGQGYQPVCGFNYGAGEKKRVRDAFKFTLIVEQIMLGCFAVVGFILAPKLIGIFRDDPEVIKIGRKALRFACVSLLAQPLTVLSNMTFQSCGKNRLASFSAMLRSGLYFIPLIIILESAVGILGVQLAQPIADVLTFVTVMPFIIRFISSLKEKNVD